jgi:hypothetical protein
VVAKKTSELEKRLGQLQAETTIKELLLEELKEKMETILPQWVRGMVTVEQMVQVYPLIMLGIAIYVLGIGLALTGHYRVIANDMKWSGEERSDPAYSSLWTLTYRGPYGTGLILAVYLVTFTCLWAFFEQGVTIFSTWHEAVGKDPVKGLSMVRPADWVVRVIWLAGVALVVLQPIRDNTWWPGSS